MTPSPFDLLGGSWFILLGLINSLTPDTNSKIAQYHRLIYRGDSIVVFNKQFDHAIIVYEKAFSITTPMQHDVLNLALLYYLSGDSLNAIRQINSCYLNPKKINIITIANFRGIQLETTDKIKFNKIYESNWNVREWKRRKKLPGAKLLFSLYRTDQFYRKWYIPYFLNRDNHNFKRLVNYIEHNGIPGVKSSMDTYFTREGLDYFSYILNHYIVKPKFLEALIFMYPQIITAINQGELYPHTLPFLIDKYLFFEEYQQIFGEMILLSGYDKDGLPVASKNIVPLCISEIRRDSLRYNFLLRPSIDLLKINRID